MTDRLAALYALIRRFEGCRLMPYYCPAGFLTCGWGSTGADVYPGKPWTQEYADKRMRQDALKFALGVSALCPALPHSDARLSAIADFAYNLGLHRLKGSTLRKRINEEQWISAKEELKKWVWGGGKKLPGLILRREVEGKHLL